MRLEGIERGEGISGPAGDRPPPGTNALAEACRGRLGGQVELRACRNALRCHSFRLPVFFADPIDCRVPPGNRLMRMDRAFLRFRSLRLHQTRGDFNTDVKHSDGSAGLPGEDGSMGSRHRSASAGRGRAGESFSEAPPVAGTLGTQACPTPRDRKMKISVEIFFQLY